jgi:site-specific recombinase XerD
MKNSLKHHNDNILPKNNNFEAGGKKDQCTILNKDLGHIVKCQPQNFGEEMADIKYIEKFKLENPRILNPSDYKTTEEFLDALEKWHIKRIGKKSTFTKRRNLLTTMIKHPIFPIDITNLNPDQIDAQLEYEKQHYNKDTNRNGKDAIVNRIKALKTVAKATNVNTDNWNLIIPEKSRPKHKIVPLPQTVYNLIHLKYSKDPYENALWGHIAFQGFLIGPRPVSEMPIMKKDNIHIDEGFIHFYQPKVDSWRMPVLEKDVMSRDTRKSYKNWIDNWRPKVENQYSKDFVYLQPNGKPFTKDYFRKKINQNYKQIYPQFHPYCM